MQLRALRRERDALAARCEEAEAQLQAQALAHRKALARSTWDQARARLRTAPLRPA